MGLDKLSDIRDEMERARVRKLQPGFIQAFFIDAFRLLKGRIAQREKDRFQITRVPHALRADPATTVAREYERVTFEPDLQILEGKPPAELLVPGHPLLEAVIREIEARYRGLLQDGAVLVDPDDPGATPRVLVYLEHQITSGTPGSRGRRPVSRRYQFIEIPEGGEPTGAGYAPYLDYQPLEDGKRTGLREVIEGGWISQALTDTAQSYAIEHLAHAHYQEISRMVTARVEKVRTAVRQRLERAIRYWDGRVYEIKAKELAGKSTGGYTSGHARNRADDLEARLRRRNRELDQELDLSNHPPRVVGGALIIPQGLLKDQPVIDDDPEARKEIDRRAVAAVMGAERRLGRQPTEKAHHNPGYDIESRCPDTGDLFFIEVKGRIEGADTVNVKARQIRQALNHPERFILALAQVPADPAAHPVVRYVRDPFEGMTIPFNVSSVNFHLKALLAESAEPS